MAALTDGERKVLNLAWQCFKDPPQVDYKKLQEMGGYKTAASATAVYLAAKKKMFATPPPPLTDGERKVLSNALHCVRSMPQVDYKKLQEMGGYKTPASATAVYLAARKKLLANNESGNGDKKRKAADVDDDASNEPKKTKKKATSKDVVTSENVTEDVDVESKSKGKKRAKSGPRKRAASPEEASEDVDAGSTDETPMKYAKKASSSEAVRSEDAIQTFPNEEDEAERPIKQEAHDEPVDMNLFISAAQLLRDQSEDDD